MNEQLAPADTLQPCLYARVTIKDANISSLLNVSSGEKMRIEFNAAADKMSKPEQPLVSKRANFPGQ